MAKYTVLADVSRTLTDLLRTYAVPEPVAKPEQIGICSPQDRGGFVVGVHPYDMKESTPSGLNVPLTLPDGRLQNPPMEFRLSYMVSVVSKAEAATRALDEQRIMGKVLQILKDYARLPEQFMPESLRQANEPLSVDMVPMELDEKIKIWSMFNEPYHMSAFFTVSPVLIESSIIRQPSPRVRTVALGSVQQEEYRHAHT